MKTPQEVREQIQEDIISFGSVIDLDDTAIDALCEIIVKNFKELKTN